LPLLRRVMCSACKQVLGTLCICTSWIEHCIKLTRSSCKDINGCCMAKPRRTVFSGRYKQGQGCYWSAAAVLFLTSQPKQPVMSRLVEM
jgi:hypothetical protein